MITLKVAPRKASSSSTNNEISTFVTVLSGGLNVLFLQGPNFTWDYRYLMRSIVTSPDIQVEGVVIRRPARGEASEVDDAEFAPGRYNIYVLSDLPADYLTPRQHKLLADAVKQGGGPDHAGRPVQLRRRGLGRDRSGRHPARRDPPRRRPARARRGDQVRPQRHWG